MPVAVETTRAVQTLRDDDSSAEQRIAEAKRTLGPYRLIRVIAEGATAIVAEAEHRMLGRRCALKTFHPKAFARSGLSVAGLTDTFLAEARLLAQFDHPHIVRLDDAGLAAAAGMTTEVPYLALRLASGGDLATWVQRSGPLAPDVAVAVIRQALDGLVAIHAAGICHGDLKPANLLANGDGSVCWADFSHARSMDSDAPCAGSREYAAPELRFGGPATIASEIYSFGATLHYLLCGVPPAGGGSAAYATIGDGTRQKLHLAAIAARCLNEDPAARYRELATLVSDLDRVANGEAPPEGAPAPRGSFIAEMWRKATH